MMYYGTPPAALGNPFEDDEQQMIEPPTPPTEARSSRPAGSVPSRDMGLAARAARSNAAGASRSVIQRTSHAQASPTPAGRPSKAPRSAENGSATASVQPRLRPLKAPKSATLRRDIGGPLDLAAPRAVGTILPAVSLEPVAREPVAREPETNPAKEDAQQDPQRLRTSIPVNPLRASSR